MVALTEERMQSIDSDTMLPDLFEQYPYVKQVFDRYGLNGCGGKRGPVENIKFFAQTHGVDECQLMREITMLVDNPDNTVQFRNDEHSAATHNDSHKNVETIASASTPPAIADVIYRRFFTTGILAVLTVGATWGAWLLWRIGYAGDFTALSIHHVNAHGHAQIFGWVGVFVMGFAYQALPRIWHVRLVAPRWAAAAFAMMLTGIIIRTAGMTFSEMGSSALLVAMTGAAVQVMAICIFVVQLTVTYLRSDKPFEPWLAFVFTAFGWFIIQAVFSAWHTWNTMAAATEEQLLWYIATYQAPLRDVQIHGLALFMILGVSQRMLPALFNVPHTGTKRAWWGWGVLTCAVISEVFLFLTYRFSHNHAIAAMLMLPWIMLIIGAWLVAVPWQLHKPLPQSDRSGKFIRAAYGWLAISLVMLLLMPVYQWISQIPFSHAYYGATRHAITVGFISLMIMGFAAKIIPTLNGIDTRSITNLTGPFVLINLGCLLRVVFQIGTDWHWIFFAVVGASGVLEVTALAWWGIGLLRIMHRGKRESQPHKEDQSRPARIEPIHTVAQVLAWYPQAQNILYQHGFHAITNPFLRRTVARTITLEQACHMHKVSLPALLEDLIQLTRQSGS